MNDAKATKANGTKENCAKENAPSADVRVSLEDVRHVAALAHLDLTPDELPRMARDLDAILGYIAQLDELDTSAVVPMAQVADALGAAPAAAGESLRTDAVHPSIDRTLVMREAPETDGRFFKVPKVIDR